jgi:exodeoxyribonuclease V beta subunit
MKPWVGNIKLEEKHFPKARWIKDNWGILSFSSMTGDSHYVPDSAGSAEEKTESALEDYSTAQKKLSENIMPEAFISFPAGAGPGQCIHGILEEFDFASPEKPEHAELVSDKLSEFGIDTETHSRNVINMLNELVEIPLQGNGESFSFRDILPGKSMSEFEFYFRLGDFNQNALKKLLKSHAPELEETAERLDFRITDGVMHGYIDFVFEYKDKFYIVDWKTNFLGPETGDYAPGKVRESMALNCYFLQAYVYTLALNSFLESGNADYSYSKNFGGVFYIYLRGINRLLPGSGICFELPSEKFYSGFKKISGL